MSPQVTADGPVQVIVFGQLKVLVSLDAFVAWQHLLPGLDVGPRVAIGRRRSPARDAGVLLDSFFTRVSDAAIVFNEVRTASAG
jgi:hypothetical protein